MPRGERTTSPQHGARRKPSSPSPGKYGEKEYRDALKSHYGRLLRLSQKTVGRPNQRESVMLDKIRQLERQLQDEQGLQSETWDPIRARLQNADLVARDRDMQINIYGLETSFQSIANMDSAFEKEMHSAINNLDDVEEEFRFKTLPGAPSFRETRAQRKSRRMGATRTNGRKFSLATRLPRLENTAPLGGREGRRVAHAQKLTGASASPSATSSGAKGTWGFPAFFGPSDYGEAAIQNRHKNLQLERSQEMTESDHMNREEEEQRTVRMLIEAEEREQDYEKFSIFAGRFGPLEGELFCMTRRPGRLYEHLAYASATLMQIWWKIMWPHRKIVKENAARLLQRRWRGRQAREMFKYMRLNEDKVKLCIRRLFHKLQLTIMEHWKQYTSQQLRMKRLMKRVMQGMEKHIVDTWRDSARELVQEREEKLRKAMARFINRQKYQVLFQWSDYAQRMLRVKAFMRRQMAAFEHTIFQDWADYVYGVVAARKELAASITIQRVSRGHLGRLRWKDRFETYTIAVLCMQRLVRGHLGRRRFDMYHREQQRQIRRHARRIERESRRKELEARKREEMERLEVENKIATEAADRVEFEFSKALKINISMLSKASFRARDEVNAKMKEMALRNGKAPERKLAIQEVIRDKRKNAMESARNDFRVDNPVIVLL